MLQRHKNNFWKAKKPKIYIVLEPEISNGIHRVASV